MKIKTSELTGTALDCMVAIALGHEVKVRTWQDITNALDPVEDADMIAFHRERNTVRVSARQIPGGGMFPNPSYSSDWSEGGPIIEREDIDILRDGKDFGARLGWTKEHPTRKVLSYFMQRGPTKLIAAMRCFVASKLGDEVDVPDELL